jgi:acetyl/propionyl-CoA carboxylase alpha subunit
VIDPSNIRFPRRIAVVNRGEAAVRLIRAVRELNAEHGCGITTIALHTDAERRAMFVRQADEAVTLRKTSGIVYLDHAELERALLEAKADAVWVGWGFVAEDIAFAELCARLKLTFIGPPPTAMRTLGDRWRPNFWPRRWAFHSHRGAVARSRPARTPAGTQRPLATR